MGKDLKSDYYLLVVMHTEHCKNGLRFEAGLPIEMKKPVLWVAGVVD